MSNVLKKLLLNIINEKLDEYLHETDLELDLNNNVLNYVGGNNGVCIPIPNSFVNAARAIESPNSQINATSQLVSGNTDDRYVAEKDFIYLQLLRICDVKNNNNINEYIGDGNVDITNEIDLNINDESKCDKDSETDVSIKQNNTDTDIDIEIDKENTSNIITNVNVNTNVKSKYIVVDIKKGIQKSENKMDNIKNYNIVHLNVYGSLKKDYSFFDVIPDSLLNERLCTTISNTNFEVYGIIVNIDNQQQYIHSFDLLLVRNSISKSVVYINDMSVVHVAVKGIKMHGKSMVDNFKIGDFVCIKNGVFQQNRKGYGFYFKVILYVKNDFGNIVLYKFKRVVDIKNSNNINSKPSVNMNNSNNDIVECVVNSEYFKNVEINIPLLNSYPNMIFPICILINQIGRYGEAGYGDNKKIYFTYLCKVLNDNGTSVINVSNSGKEVSENVECCFYENVFKLGPNECFVFNVNGTRSIDDRSVNINNIDKIDKMVYGFNNLVINDLVYAWAKYSSTGQNLNIKSVFGLSRQVKNVWHALLLHVACC